MSDTGNPKFVPYEANHRLRSLFLVTTVVPQGQAEFVLQISKDNEAAICLVCRGTGTYSQEDFPAMPQKKDVVFSLIREDRWENYKKTLEARFAVSKIAKGIAYAIPLDSVAGVSIYKMLTNTRLFEKPISANKDKKGVKNNG